MIRKLYAWLLCLALLLGLMPAGVAFAADTGTTIDIEYQGSDGNRVKVGTTTLSLTGSTLTYAANIATPGYEMTRFSLQMGQRTVDVSLAGAQRTSYTGQFTNASYDEIKNYSLSITLAGPQAETKTQTFVSNTGSFPGATVVTSTSTFDSWHNLSWSEGAEFPGVSPAMYFAEAGATYIWDRADTNSQGGTEAKTFCGSFELPKGAVVTKALLAITADNAYSMAVGGKLFTMPASKGFLTNANGDITENRQGFGVYDWSWSFVNVETHNLTGVLKGGSNPFTLKAYNSEPLPNAYNPAGVIYRLDVTYTLGGSGAGGSYTDCKSGTIPPPSGQTCALAVGVKLIRINGALVAPNAVAKPGDVLTFEMTLANTGTISVRPGPITVSVPAGLTASNNDNATPPWTISGQTMTFASPGPIHAGNSERVEFVLRVPQGSSGSQTINVSAPTLIAPDDSTVPNPTPNASTTVVVDGGTVPTPTYGLRITHVLKYVNDAPAPSNYTAKPGDKLTFTMQMRNVGTAPVRPGTVNVRYTSGLYAQSGDNAYPPWMVNANMLVYTHDGSLIAVGAQRDVDYILRVRSDCPSGNQTIDTDVPVIIDESGNNQNNTIPGGSITIPVGPGGGGAPDYALRITHKLIKVNDQYVYGPVAINPGDKLTFTMTMSNVGRLPVRPGTVNVNLSAGLYAQQSDNPNPPWTVYSQRALTYTHDGSMIAVGGSRDVDYVVRVAPDCPQGNQTIDTSAPYVYDATGASVANATPTDSFSFPISGGVFNVTTKFWLAYVNGRSTGWTVDGPMPTNIAISPGDVLTYMLRTTNHGTVRAYPTEYVVSLPAGQTFDPGENPGWVQRDGNLVYSYNNGYIDANTYIEVPLRLRVKKGHPSTINITVVVSQIRTEDGKSQSGGSTTLCIPVDYSEYGDMTQTGESPLTLLPVLCGGLMLLGGGSLFLTRRRKVRARK